MNKWRKWARRYKRNWKLAIRSLNEWIERCNALSESEAAALNKIEELRRDNVRLATELARVQGVCEDTQARLVSLQESDTLDLLEKKRLLAWRVRVRDAWAHYKKAHLSEKWTEPVDYLRQTIEGEPKEET